MSNKLILSISGLLLLVMGLGFCVVIEYFSQQESNVPYDLNGDGKQDIFYEEEIDHVFELMDKNFDGNIDESFRYSYEGIFLGGKLDENFDGRLETTIVAINGIVSKALVDGNLNGLHDICFEYHGRALRRSYKYYPSNPVVSTAKIGVVEFRFGYPLFPERLISTDLNTKRFSDLVSENEAADCLLEDSE